MMPYNYLILCDLLLLLPSIFPSIRVFPMCQLFASTGQRTGASASASVLPMNIHSWFPFRIDQFDLLVIRGTLESLLQHRSLKVLILQYSAFFMTQLSHPHMTTGKTIASTVQTFVGKVMFLLFNMLSGLVITFLLRRKRLNFMAEVSMCNDFGAPQNKVSFCFHILPTYLPWSDGTRCHDLSFLNVEL